MDPRTDQAPRRRRWRITSRSLLPALATLATFAPLAPAQSLQLAIAQSLQQLGSLSIEELAAVEITSVSKRAEPLASAASAVYVITADDIRRTGVTSLPEALRLAPNLEVARVDSQDYAISARGMNSVNASNKLLVLIDGRSVYTPFFSSVFWDQQQVTLADIDRIEVISGPGGVLWGANAVNGVVNIVTKRAAATPGELVDARVGDFTQRADARWGGRLGSIGDYRIYALGDREGDTRLAGGASADDAWRARQAGFRADLAALAGDVTVQGDVYENIVDSPGGHRSGGNLLGRWSRRLDNGSDVEVQAYYDQQARADVSATGGGSSDRVRTLDIEAQHAFAIGAAHRIVWGASYRAWDDEFTNTANPFVLVPQAQTLDVASVFAQDTIALPHRVDLTLGAKYEYNSFSGSALMPSVRVGWQADADNFLWAAISRAVRPPSRLERDLTAPGIVDTSPGFGAENLVAYEAGYRAQLAPTATLSVSLYYNDYDDLRTTSPAPVTVLPVTFGNGLEGHTFGVDAWGSVSLAPWWRLDPGITLLRKDFHLKPGQFDIAGTQTVLGHDPGHQVFMRSYMDLPHDIELYVGLRHIGGLDEVGVPAYFEADVRLAWHASRRLELSLAGLNLVHRFHAEASAPPVHEIPRSVYAGLRWSY
jgi:iron complex outermembrane receptor protein